MPFTTTFHRDVPRVLFRTVQRGKISLRLFKEERKSWDIQEKDGIVFPLAHWGKDFKGI
jgi:hypothetical protein